MFWRVLLYRVKRWYHLIKTGWLMGVPAQFRQGFPARQIKVIAFTGTDGKTTTSTLMYQVLRQAGMKVALLSTVAAYIGDEEIDTGFHVTSPSPQDLQRFLRKMVDQGIEYLVMEVTSHGLYQYRTWGVSPFMAGLTNISHEHLDYHLDYELYVEAKSFLFRGTPVVILNEDDASFSKIKKYLNPKRQHVVAYGEHTRLPKPLKQAIETRFPEAYNRQNARLVATGARILGIPPTQVAQAIRDFSGVPGRMQVIPNQQGLHVVVDFAHTPQALWSALTALREYRQKSGKKNARIIAVFGCAGLRDTSKRPAMGKIGAELADRAIFTSEDPRTENVWAIIDQMKSQAAPYHGTIMALPDRRQAIEQAILREARRGDIVGIFGKGHEKSMCFGTTEHPWHDASVVAEIIAQRNHA